ncbi:MAG TPA: ABC transporter permease [Vicinamibacterales bacterium]|nr:ABC transporter permease [Vicinamibacterales bacterium]
MTRARAAGFALAAAIIVLGVAGPLLSANDPSAQFTDFVYAPPMRPRIIDASGQIRAPFVYPLQLANRLERRYAEDRSRPVPLRVLTGGRFVSVDPAANIAWFPLGTDALGRDQLARLAAGTRLSLGVALTAALFALVAGALAGGLAGQFRGLVDDGLMRLADFVIALPAVYVVLALRAAMPLFLSTSQVFWTMAMVLAVVGWPLPARGVRAVVAAERSREYAEAARAIGASRTRLLLRHLLPAARGFLVVQTTLLVPAFVLAEATLSYVGLGFAEPTPSWGAMLREAGTGGALLDAPWLLAPALAIVATTLAVNLLAPGEFAHLRTRARNSTP